MGRTASDLWKTCVVPDLEGWIARNPSDPLDCYATGEWTSFTRRCRALLEVGARDVALGRVGDLFEVCGVRLECVCGMLRVALADDAWVLGVLGLATDSVEPPGGVGGYMPVEEVQQQLGVAWQLVGETARGHALACVTVPGAKNTDGWGALVGFEDSGDGTSEDQDAAVRALLVRARSNVSRPNERWTARRDVERAAKAAVGAPRHLVEVGDAWLELFGDADRARTCYLLAASPDLSSAGSWRVAAAWGLLRAGDAAAAVEIAERCLRCGPDVKAVISVARVLARCGAHERARGLLAQACDAGTVDDLAAATYAYAEPSGLADLRTASALVSWGWTRAETSDERLRLLFEARDLRLPQLGALVVEALRRTGIGSEARRLFGLVADTPELVELLPHMTREVVVRCRRDQPEALPVGACPISMAIARVHGARLEPSDLDGYLARDAIEHEPWTPTLESVAGRWVADALDDLRAEARHCGAQHAASSDARALEWASTHGVVSPGRAYDLRGALDRDLVAALAEFRLSRMDH